MEQQSAQQVKVYFGEEIRRFAFSGNSFINLVKEIKRLFNFDEGEMLTISYEDGEHDKILVTSNEELQTATAISGKLLKLYISAPKGRKMEIEPATSSPKESAEPPKRKEKKDWKEMRKNGKEFKAKYQAELVKEKGFYEVPTIAPSTQYTKTWKVRNESEENWPEGCTLTFHRGDMMEGPKSIPVPQVAPGKEVALSITLTSPAAQGRYIGIWRLNVPFSSKGEIKQKKFGPALKVKIVVSDGTQTNGKNIIESSSDSSSEEVEKFESKKRRDRKHGKRDFEKRPKIDDLSPLLSQLEKMGFEDKEKNLKLLNKAHGNLDIVVAKLIKKNKKNGK